MPVGTKAEHDRAEAKKREQRENTEQERLGRLTSLKERSGVERLRYATAWQRTDYRSVTLSIEDFEKLLDAAGR